MGRIPASYLINRLFTLFLTVFIAATLIWIIPRLSPIDPVDVMLGRMAAGGGSIENSATRSWRSCARASASISR
jgi:peptide/nickel transport system permease protein